MLRLPYIVENISIYFVYVHAESMMFESAQLYDLLRYWINA